MAVLSSLCCIFRPLGVADYVVATEFSCQQDLQAVVYWINWAAYSGVLSV